MHRLSPLYKRRTLNQVLACFVCLSSAGQTAWAEENSDQQLTFQDIFRATELRLVQGTAGGFSVEGIAGISGTAIAVKIRLPSQVDENAGGNATRRFLMFRGLPDELTLTSGFRTRNVWIVAVADLGNLKMNVPPNYRGNTPIEVLLYQGETKAPESRTISIDIIPPGKAVDTRTGADAKQPGPNKPAKNQSRGALGALQEEAELLSQGETHLRNGNVVFARALFEELAARGSARGAFAVAQTYDAAVLQQIGAVGIQGDVEKAKSWYRKAAELGNAAPIDILSSLKKDLQ
jgi:hypothetical protein